MRSLLVAALLAVHLQLLGGPLEQAQRAIDAGRVREAVQWLRPLARQGDPSAQWSLARLLELPGRSRDLAEALRWYLRLAEAGRSEAMEAVGLAHYLGRGTAIDLLQAADWFRQAGERGEVGSQYLLASMYEKGEGLPQDPRLARAWYARAAAQGDVAAAVKRDLLDRAQEDPPLTAPP